ncbi:type III restriction enzyme, res subunit [Natrinema pellirubrum DSM 15624]|uniref:DNA/RNA helicase, superfamily II n=1 Tax=Natrinema pellirubrum (strain DSM 15624 / CIP 106293 / JCM 10476 / NCIMB 786 / 157) TaxID=797303 RepID=L0JT92_NATP1|nr:DEAD/DEAH box helicase family protein [Natrinema pellirubrum]AGB34033.1 DNA/RNA helicase, superfamily II [Natrinema pellirubrum DSM 15624]ELY69585.1 type III restriction enzyme, res subunit [Natrinema pellirubrum DSM 15624]
MQRALSTFIRLGIVREVDGKISIWKFADEFANGEIEYAEFLWRGIKQSWVLAGNFPEGIEGLRRVHYVVIHAEEPLSSTEIRDQLTAQFDYEYNDAGIRGYPELLVQLGALRQTDDGYVTGPRSSTFENRWRRADVFFRLERWFHHRGPSVDVPRDTIKKALVKYYMYRESGGWGRHRQLYNRFLEDYVRETSRKSDVANPQIHLSESYQKDEDIRGELRERIKEKFPGIGGQELGGLYEDTLRDILAAETEAEAREIRAAASPGISRRDLQSRVDTVRDHYTPPPDFSLFDWQREAIDDWFSDGDSAPERGIAQVVTGAGKTVMALGAINEWLQKHPDGVVTVVVPTKVLMHQWLREFVDKLNAPLSDIGWAGDGHKDSHEDCRILVSIVNSAVKDDYLETSLRDANTDDHLLVADECHRYTGDVHSRVLEYPNSATLGLSATPLSTINPESDDLTEDDERLLDALGSLFYRLSYEEGIDRGLISEFTINYVGFELTPAERHTYDQFSKKVSSAVQDIEARHSHRLAELQGSYPQKLQTIMESSNSATPAISDFFEYTTRRRELIAEAVSRQAITHRLLESAIEADKKSIVFQERIEQLEQMIAPYDQRDEKTQTGKYGSKEQGRANLYHQYETELEEVNRDLENLFFSGSYAPVMYHSGHRNDEWNDWAIEWFRDDGFANVMLSVQALKEGVDVPSADVGIIRVSSGNVRERIQTLGRILRTGNEPDEPSTLYVLYARDTVDERIFEEVDWKAEIGGTHQYYRWETGEEVIKGDLVGPDPEFEPDVSSYQPPEIPDISELERGDPYEGPRRGRTISVNAEGRPFQDSADGRKFITTPEVEAVAEYVYRLRGGGRIIVNEADHMITVTEEGPVFLGVLEADSFEYEEDDDDVPESFEEFIS